VPATGIPVILVTIITGFVGIHSAIATEFPLAAGVAAVTHLVVSIIAGLEARILWV
tara:strand:- start:64 stop:231 length:168 start_codon:yes stop_codon:yes gene_type:complete